MKVTVISIENAFRKKVRSDEKADPAFVKDGQTVWLALGLPERKQGRYSEELGGCITVEDSRALRAAKAEENRKRKPYDRRTMRSELRNTESSTSFVRTPDLDPSERTDDGPANRPTRSLIGTRPRTEAVRRRGYLGPSEDGVPFGAPTPA